MPWSSPPSVVGTLMRSGPGRPNFGLPAGTGSAGMTGATGRPETDGYAQEVGRSAGRAPGTGVRAGLAGVGCAAARPAPRRRIAPLRTAVARRAREVTSSLIGSSAADLEWKHPNVRARPVAGRRNSAARVAPAGDRG